MRTIDDVWQEMKEQNRRERIKAFTAETLFVCACILVVATLTSWRFPTWTPIVAILAAIYVKIK